MGEHCGDGLVGLDGSKQALQNKHLALEYYHRRFQWSRSDLQVGGLPFKRFDGVQDGIKTLWQHGVLSEAPVG